MSKMKMDSESKFDYKNVFLYPQYSEITSRSEVDTSVRLTENLKLDTPVISANMDTVTDGNMALEIYKAGAIGAIHRFLSIEQNVKEWQIVKDSGGNAFVSVGVNSESKERAMCLFDAGARYFIIDIAHGHSKMMRDMIFWMRETFKTDVYIVAGNIATPQGAQDLFLWGADAVKIGIGPGSVCTTKNVTGTTVPQFSAVFDVCNSHNKEECYKLFYNKAHVGNKPIFIADGGVQEIGDIAKALGAGADLVMCGRLFAGCPEAPGPRINNKKIYRGMASTDAMLTIRDASLLPTPEGISIVLDESEESIHQIIKHIKGGLQSAFSYANSRNLSQFQMFAKFGVRYA